jgi:hypothetical protein
MISKRSVSFSLAVIIALITQSSPLTAETLSLAFGERAVLLDVPSGCSLSEARPEIYDCQYRTSRNKVGGSYDESSEIVVAAKEVDPPEITKYSQEIPKDSSKNLDDVSVISLAEASQSFILATDHSVFRSSGGMYKHLSLVGRLDESNSLVVSQGQPWGGSDCRIFVTGAGLTMANSTVLGVERGGMRCILWSYSKGGTTARALDVIVEVREWDDFQPNGSESFMGFWQPIIQSVRFQ